MPTQGAIDAADMAALETLPPQILQKINETVDILRSGQDPYLALRMLCAVAYMDGMLAMAKIDLPS